MSLYTDFSSSTNSVKTLTAQMPTTFPLSIGGWFNSDNNGGNNQYAINFCSSAGANNKNFLSLRASTAGAWQAATDDGTTAAQAGGGVQNVGVWEYVVARFLTTTSRRLDVLHFDGTTNTFNNLTAVNWPASTIDTMSLSALCSNGGTPVIGNDYKGHMAEVWWSDTDICPTGALTTNFLSQLAYRGPWAFPHIGLNLLGYRSFRAASYWNHSDDFTRNGDKVPLTGPSFTNVLLKAHPPLYPGYVRPNQSPLNLVI